MSSSDDNGWFVYMIRCDDDSLYTGITKDLVRRWAEHAGQRGSLAGNREKVDRQRSGQCKEGSCEGTNPQPTSTGLSRGAKFFRGRKPLQFAYVEGGHDRSSASRREAAIKRLPRAAKLQLLTADHNELPTLDRALLPIFNNCPTS